MNLKSHIKNFLINYPRIFEIARYIRWLPKKIADFIAINGYRILHHKEIINADVVLSIGNHCQAAYYMQEYHLRKFASPIDWMKYYSLESLFQLFQSDFASFFSSYYEDTIKAQDNGYCRWLVDTNNGMIARHHFLKQLPLESQFQSFREKQIKRFEKIKSYLKDSTNIVFVSCREDSLENLAKFLLNFQTLYKNANLTIVNFRDDKEKTYKKTEIINDKAKIIEYCFDNTYPLKKNQTLDEIGGITWIGNYKKWGGA